MKRFCVIALLYFLLLPTIESEAQTRGRRTAAARRRARASTQPAPKDEARTAARRDVAEQIKLLTRFVYLFGRISSGIEMADEQARQDQARQDAAQLSQRSKAALIENLRNVRAGLDDLETRFRTLPELATYHPNLSGVAARVAVAEQRAAAGQLDQAGRTLLEVVYRLTELLLEMR